MVAGCDRTELERLRREAPTSGKELLTLRDANDLLRRENDELKKSLNETNALLVRAEKELATAKEHYMVLLEKENARLAANSARPILSGEAFYRSGSGEIISAAGQVAYLLSEGEGSDFSEFQKKLSEDQDRLKLMVEGIGGVRGIRLYADWVRENERMAKSASHRATVGVDGRYSFSSVPAGKYLLFVPLCSDKAAGWWQISLTLDSPKELHLNNANVGNMLSL